MVAFFLFYRLLTFFCTQIENFWSNEGVFLEPIIEMISRSNNKEN